MQPDLFKIAMPNSSSIKREMVNKYNISDTIAYICGSIILYKGKPVLASHETDENKILLCDIVTKTKVVEVELNSPDFDIQSPEMGYFNLLNTLGNKKVNQALYAYRVPSKNWKQGLSTNNTCVMNIDGTQSESPGHIYTEGFKESLLDKFPSLDDAFNMLNNPGPVQISSLALSRDIALAKRASGVFLVFYKMEEVGFIDKNRNVNVPNIRMGWVIEKYLSRLNWKIQKN